MYKILVVDDDYITREGIVNHVPFEEMGISCVLQADDGINALEIARKELPDIVLSDICMPRMDGISFAYQLKTMLPQAVLIFMSAYTEKEYYKSAIKLKAVSFIEKPLDRDELIQVISNAVSELERQSELEPLLNSRTVLKLIEEKAANTQDKLRAFSPEISASGHFISMVLRLTDTEKSFASRNELTILMNKVLNEVFNEYQIQGTWAWNNNLEAVIILYTQHNTHFRLQDKVLMAVGLKLQENFSPYVKLSIAIGPTVTGADDIYKSYLGAISTLKKLFFKRSVPVSLHLPESGLVYHVKDTLFNEFSRIIESGNKGAADAFIRELSSEISRHPDTPVNEAKNIYFNLSNILRGPKPSLENIQNSKHAVSDVWEKFSGMDTLDEVEKFVIGRIDEHFKAVSLKQENGASVCNLIQYIQAHYADPGLSIEVISKHSGLSQAYLCVIFKQKTGQTINQYINEYRINKAKDLMRNGNTRISEVARDTGFTVPDYFAKVFRKVTGMSPSEYKERCAP